MMEPLSLDTVLSEFSEDSEAWVIQSKKNGKYLTIPDNRYPGRKPIRFFLSKLDAERVLAEVLKVNPGFTTQRLEPTNVKLLQALRSLSADKTLGHADSFVIHSPNEVYEFIHNKLQ
ncbi:MAG: hypothetical protein HY799_00995 [Nitrosomonadales bacterium]|nr:hypothetical protein [Nitrosomonadales bacterium]